MASVSETQIPPAGIRWKSITLLGLLATAAALVFYYEVPVRVQALLKQVLDWLVPLGAWGPILFVLLYVASCVALIPASLLTLGAGAVFGVVKGFILVHLGATLGAAAAFLVGRHCARDWVARKMAGHPKFAAIDRAVADEGWKIVLLTRLSPVFPFFLLNYGYGLTRVSFRHYFLATWLGIIPGSLLFVYIGSLANPSEARGSALAWTFKIVGLLATILVTVHLTRIARRALAQKIDSNGRAKTDGEPSA
jgi:uncharacterized membrane protein YdjX (TVP38/TMEM64 family)